MRQSHHIYWLVKSGHLEKEYEDAFAVSPSDALPFRAAVADGATESAYAKVWAQILTRGFVDSDLSSGDGFEQHLVSWRHTWCRHLETKIRDVPWYTSAKVAEGAYAAFLGLSIMEDGSWVAVSVGDCCLFHVRVGKLVQSWPFEDADLFTTSPHLISTLPDTTQPEILTRAGTWSDGDAFMLATDAVAAWMLRTGAFEAGFSGAEAFRARIHSARGNGTIRNDDVTLLVVEVRS